MQLKEVMKNAGIVGAGGAGFPAYGKLADGADTLLINGAECEPLLYTDYIILKRELALVLCGIGAVLDYAKIPRALLCVKDHTAKRLKWQDGEKLKDRIFVKILPDVYPMGDEISMIYQATGRVVKPGNLPITEKVIVYNVETMYNVAVAVKNGAPVTAKWVMIGGDIDQPFVVRVPVGTPVWSLFEKYGVTVPEEGYTVIDGGPAMGKVIDPERAVITKTTKSLLILPDQTPAMASKMLNAEKSIARAETACCQCTRCTDLCPRHLLGYPLEPHKMVRTAMQPAKAMPSLVISATLCCGCGICETLACSQGISPRAVIENYKGVLAQNKMRYVADRPVNVSPERDWRMIPSERWSSVLGVAKFDKLAVYKGEDLQFARVEIPVKQHIGAPSVPCVKEGDTVKRGDLIAQSAEGLSLPQYASIDGTVTFVEDGKIIIEQV
ncbi:MAG: 4Fe-4S dicluster domain-containing protein [Clostridia bacterium]|nr:4Fe-4S dicluster domain-containing protein [Clostridia bacterium]